MATRKEITPQTDRGRGRSPEREEKKMTRSNFPVLKNEKPNGMGPRKKDLFEGRARADRGILCMAEGRFSAALGRTTLLRSRGYTPSV